MEESHELLGYAGLPLLLQHFRTILTRLMSKLMGIGKQKPSDKGVHVPTGNSYYYKHISAYSLYIARFF